MWRLRRQPHRARRGDQPGLSRRRDVDCAVRRIDELSPSMCMVSDLVTLIETGAQGSNKIVHFVAWSTQLVIFAQVRRSGQC